MLQLHLSDQVYCLPSCIFQHSFNGTILAIWHVFNPQSICYTIWIDWHRRVWVWSLPWRWHILSIPLTTGRGTGAETCGFDDVFPPDDLCSRPEVRCLYIYICIFYMSSVIGRIYTYNRSVIQYWWSCTPSHSIGLYFYGVRSSWAECHFLFSLVYQLCLARWW